MTAETPTGQRADLPRLLSLTKVAAQLDVSTKTVRRAIKRGELPVHRIGRQARVSDWDLAAYIALRRKSPRPGL
jgi:excisionase family DNA binding protein